MKISKTTKLIIIGILSLTTLLVIIFGIVKAIGNKYGQNINNQEFDALNQQLNQQDHDIHRIRLVTSDGRIIEILQNGTLIRTDGDNTKQAILGFGKLNQLFSSLTEEEIIKLYNSQSSSGGGYTITFETKNGNIYIIEIPVDDIPDELEDLIDDIEDTTDDILDPTPFPSSLPTTTPIPTPPPSGTPYPTPTPTPPPSGTPYPTPTPNPDPSSLPEYMTAPPFDCSDYDLIKNTIISNIICNPNP